MVVYIWRHPKPIAVNGICIGQTDVSVDNRKLKRLANKIERFVRLNRLPKVIWVSPLQRSLKVGQILSQRGFDYRVAPALSEINFGRWDGQPWTQIPKQDIDEWCDSFADFSPQGGESLQHLFNRAKKWLDTILSEQESPVLIIGHAGWINAAHILAAGEEIPKIAAEWPHSVAYLSRSRLNFESKSC